MSLGVLMVLFLLDDEVSGSVDREEFLKEVSGVVPFLVALYPGPVELYPGPGGAGGP